MFPFAFSCVAIFFGLFVMTILRIRVYLHENRSKRSRRSQAFREVPGGTATGLRQNPQVFHELEFLHDSSVRAIRMEREGRLPLRGGTRPLLDPQSRLLSLGILMMSRRIHLALGPLMEAEIGIVMA
jgi:hypothetical protein